MTVETNHGVFSSEGGITLADEREDFKLPMFIAMDPPKHDAQRKVVSPIVSPHNLAQFERDPRTGSIDLRQSAGRQRLSTGWTRFRSN